MNSFFLIVFATNPELRFIFHNTSQHSPSQEHHVFSAWGVFNSAAELGKFGFISLQYLRKGE